MVKPNNDKNNSLHHVMVKPNNDKNNSLHHRYMVKPNKKIRKEHELLQIRVTDITDVTATATATTEH